MDGLPINGCMVLFWENGDRTGEPILMLAWGRKHFRQIQLTSLKLSTALKVPDPPPTIITPFPTLFAPVASNLGWRDMLFLRVQAGWAVTRILPFWTWVWKEWSAIGAGASSMRRSDFKKEQSIQQLHTYVPRRDVETGYKDKEWSYIKGWGTPDVPPCHGLIKNVRRM